MKSRKRIDEELRRTDDALFAAVHQRTRLMRPPFGQRDFLALDQARKLGYTVVMWSVPLPKDWEQPGDRTIAARVERYVRDGAIIVLHDGNRGLVCSKLPPAARHPCDRSQEIAATRDIIEDLSSRGYRFVTIPQLLADSAATRSGDRATQ